MPTVLLVDDYPDTLDVWALYLRGAGFAVLTAADGAAAIDVATRDVPDLVVMDLELPGVSGFDVARTLQAQPATRHIPLLAATGYSSAHQIEAARQCGFAAVLVKPCDPEALVAEMRRLLAEADGSAPTVVGQPPASSG